MRIRVALASHVAFHCQIHALDAIHGRTEQTPRPSHQPDSDGWPMGSLIVPGLGTPIPHALQAARISLHDSHARFLAAGRRRGGQLVVVDDVGRGWTWERTIGGKVIEHDRGEDWGRPTTAPATAGPSRPECVSDPPRRVMRSDDLPRYPTRRRPHVVTPHWRTPSFDSLRSAFPALSHRCRAGLDLPFATSPSSPRAHRPYTPGH